MRARRAGLGLAAVGALGLLTTLVGLRLRLDFVLEWFYSLTWWSYILLADGLVRRRTGASLLLSRTPAFLLLLPWSCAFWLLFEAANLVLQNWYYVGLPSAAGQRLLGMGIAFATVLPGIYVTAELLRSFRLPQLRQGRGWRLQRGLLLGLTGGGVACLALPLLWPRYFFPLIWLALLLLIEPWLAQRGTRSLLGELAAGRAERLGRFLLAGLVTGLLWETWNAPARSRWIYTVPFFEEGKLFEMPVLGFLGFLPFALEAYAFGRMLVVLGLVPEWELEAAAQPWKVRRATVAAAAAILVSVPLLLLTDAHTVRATVPRVDEIAGLPEPVARALQAEGLGQTARLLEAVQDGRLPRSLRDQDPEQVQAWLAQAALMEVRGLGRRGACWLARCGVRSVAQLAGSEPQALEQAIAGAPAGSCPSPAPAPAELRVWIRGARAAAAEP